MIKTKNEPDWKEVRRLATEIKAVALDAYNGKITHEEGIEKVDPLWTDLVVALCRHVHDPVK